MGGIGEIKEMKGTIVMKEKYVQIPYSLFIDILRIIVFESQYVDIEKVRKQLEEKVNAMVAHDLYTKSKTAGTAEEREEARQKYLDDRCIHKDFRW